MKKILSLLWGIGIIALSSISCTFAYTQEQQEAYQWAYKYGITTQPTIEAANLNGNITRQAFSKMVVNYLEKVVWVKQVISSSCSFLDESSITNDLKPYAKKTCAYDIMWSNWKNFNPSKPVDRAQLWTVLSRILWWDKYNVSGQQYYMYHLNALKQNGIMSNINNPQAYAKRWDVLIMLKRTYEKFGSNVSMNWNQTSAYNDAKITDNNINDKSTDNKDNDNKTVNIEDNEYDDYISVVYSNSNVIYTWKDGTKYHYDADFLNMLKDEANKKWESDLVKYLEIEAKYYINAIEQLESLDMDNIPEMLWIDEDIDPETMTKKEKEELLKKIKDWVNKIIKENKDRNDEYVSKLQKITKNISNDKFWLKDKYKKTKEFMDTTDSFLVLYSEIIFEVMEMALTSEEWEIDDESGMGMVFWLMAAALAYQGEAEKYQGYIEDWAIKTIKSLWSNSSNSNKSSNTSNNSSKDDNKSSETPNKSSSASSDSSWIDEVTKNWKWDIIRAEDLVSKKENKHSAYVKLEKRTLFIDEEYNYILKIWPEFVWYTMEVYYNDINEVAEIYMRSNSNDIWFQVRVKPREDCKYINFSYGNEYIWGANDERVFTRYSRYKNDWAELITNVKSWKSVDELDKQHNCKAQWF